MITSRELLSILCCYTATVPGKYCREMRSAGLPRKRRLRTVQCIALLLPSLISNIYSVWPQGSVSCEYLPPNQPGVPSHRCYGIRDHSIKDANIMPNILCLCPPIMAIKIPRIFALFGEVNNFIRLSWIV